MTDEAESTERLDRLQTESPPPPRRGAAYRSFGRRDGWPVGLTLEHMADIVTLKEAAEATRLTDRIIRMAIKSGELKAFIPGGRDPRKPGRGVGYRIWTKDLQAWFFGAARGGAK